MIVEYKTISECIFFELCSRLGYVVTKIPEDKNSYTPDFIVTIDKQQLIAEVKQIDDNPETKSIEKNLLPYRFGEDEEMDMHIGDVKVGRPTLITSKFDKAVKQLESSSNQGKITLLAIYLNRFLGRGAYEPQIALDQGNIKIPPEISAIMLIQNVDIVTGYPDFEPYKIYPNKYAKVPWGESFFL